MKLILVLSFLIGPSSAFASNMCSSLFDSTLISDSEAKELFEFILKLDNYGNVHSFTRSIEKMKVHETAHGKFVVDFSRMYYDKTELKRVQRSLRAAGLRADHPIFLENIDISNPRFKKNKMNSNQAKELFDFLIANGFDESHSFRVEYRGLIINEKSDGGITTYEADFRNLNNTAELGTLQAMLRLDGFSNLKHPIFN